ncbi:MAG: DUF4139 domain-containing protein [Candidatus Eremiobacteraeota bacterium]|nr:DUF4139 domain-containing protein [Candidatus Eremiobacteraeota bacterium]MBV8366025.1 DUF4139 domain-containing protein [Candidatus Eremiobacteraeota bacterium]
MPMHSVLVRAAGALIAFALLVPQPVSADPGERVSTLAEQQAVSITIYNDNLALVRDERRLALPKGVQQLALRDVSAQIDPTTAILHSLTSAGAIAVIEQNFNFDLLSPETLLEKYVGREVTVVHANYRTGAETREQARVLAVNGGVVLQYANRIETAVDGRLVFASIPANLRDRPTLVTQIDNAYDGEQSVELDYLTGGLSWHADYVGVLNGDDSKLDLNGLVTLTNTSGTSYNNARMQLVAGNLNRVQTPQEVRTLATVTDRAANAGMRQETLFEYHLYTLGRLTTIADKQTKQVAMLSASAVPVTKSLELRGEEYYYTQASSDLGQMLKPQVFLEFQNDGGGLGIPLPKGIVRIYKKDSQGNAQFVGEDQIDHTARKERVRLRLGESFDVTATKKQTDFKRVGPFNDRYQYESSYTIEMRNAKNAAVTLKVVEPMPGDWTILAENYPHVKSSSATATWTITLPADGKETLEYTMRVLY